MKKQNGLTLIELMAATIILVIIVGVAVPSMTALNDRKQGGVVGPAFQDSIMLARSEAIRRGQIVRITSTSGTLDWSQGWRIEAVDNANPLNFELIRVMDGISGKSSLISSHNPLLIQATGQAGLGANVVLVTPGSSCITYSLLVSGLVSRSETPCP